LENNSTGEMCVASTIKEAGNRLAMPSNVEQGPPANEGHDKQNGGKPAGCDQSAHPNKSDHISAFCEW